MEPDARDRKQFEVQLLTNFQQIEDTNIALSAKGILSGRYGETLNEHFEALNLESLLKDGVLSDKVSQAVESKLNLQSEWLNVGISALCYFVQCNWTGPEDVEDVSWLVEKRDEALANLAFSDQCNDNVVKPELLYLAKTVFSSKELQNCFHTTCWWLLRANFLHQIILEEASNELFEESEALILKIGESELLQDDSLKTLFNVEATQFYLHNKRIQGSEKHLEIALETSQLSLELQGAMGKRTKFQQEAKAQLYLKVEVGKEIFPYRPSPDLPKPLELNDELRLERIEFTEVKERPVLGSLEESVILAKCFQLQLSQPKDKLTDEEIIPYLNNVIEYTKNWPLIMSALHQRCIMELRDKRTVERAMAQAENLMELFNNAKPPTCNRLDSFFASGMKPLWTFKQILADAMLSLGLVKGALDFYLKLHLWEDVIVCYTILDLRHKVNINKFDVIRIRLCLKDVIQLHSSQAAEIIRQEIAKKPSVKLWCLLGDATQETEHYETAWKLSGEKSSRAQRHWGFYYFSKQNYEEAIPHLKLSVDLNNIQENVWIRLGFAALQVEDWKLAATAYRRYCNLEQTTFEAWNNLAKAYVKLGDKPRAWRSLQDAIKCNYDRWEVWDNLMVVSIDIGHFSEVIRCYHRILDLKGQHIDVQVLSILTKAVRENRNDADGNPSRRLLPKTLELFGRLTALVLTNPDIWRLYAELTILNNTELDSQKAAQYLQRAYRASISDHRWFQTVPGTKDVLDLCVNLGKTYLSCYENASIAQKRSMLGSAKLCLQSVLSKVKNQELIEQEPIAERAATVEELLKKITEEFDKVRVTE